MADTAPTANGGDTLSAELEALLEVEKFPRPRSSASAR